MRYLQIQIRGYRALADVMLDLHPLTVMIGPNGSGKTSMLEVFQLLKDAAQSRLEEAITNHGGLGVILSHTSDTPFRLEIALQMIVDSVISTEPVSYRFVLEPRVFTYAIALEQYQWPRTPQDPQPYFFELKETTSRELRLAITDLSVSLGDILAKTLSLGSLDVGSRAPIRLPQAIIPASHPGRNGESLFAALYNMRESKASRPFYERVEETLHLAFPDFDHLELQVVGAGQITLAWHEKSLTIPLYPTQLSEGTLRFLWLTTALLSPEPPPLILIDEPEVSLHPELLKILAALLQDTSARIQLLVATHSSDLIRWLQPDEVVVIDKVEGKSTFTWASDPSLNLDEWLKEYTLSDLWLMGNLGGRP